MRRFLPLVLPLLLPVSARADALHGTKASEMKEAAHEIELRLDKGHGVLVVRRTFANGAAAHDQAQLDIDVMPAGAVATGLRTLAYQNGVPIWYAGELLEAELAAKRYQFFTGIGGAYPKDPALLSWRSATHLFLQVFPIDPKGKKTIEYTLEAPTVYENGKYVLSLPAMGQGSLFASMVLRAVDPKDQLFVDGIPVVDGHARRLSSEIEVQLAPASPPKLGGRFVSVGFAKKRALVRAAIEAAPKLSELPKEAHVVLVLDASRSLTAAQRAAQVEAAGAYLASLPDAKVEVLLFHRKVQARHGAFVDAKKAIADLRAMTWKPENGSALDVALSEAAKRVSTAPSGAPRRIVAMTDLRTRSTLLPSSIKGLDATKAIVHLATIDEGAPSVERNDDDPWAVVPRATGGLLWRARASAKPNAKAVFEEWARPLRIDRLTTIGVGLTSLSLPSSLAEGEGWSEARLGDFPTPAIEVRGELWATPIKTTFSSTAAEERRWSALVFGTDLVGELSEPEMMVLASRGGAVSPVTSYLAIEPGVRPSTAGLDWSGIARFGTGAGGGGAGFGYGSGVLLKTPNRLGWLKAQLAAAHAACGGTTKLHVRVETTLSEIAGLDVVSNEKNDALRSCVEEAAWKLELPPMFDESFAKFGVDVG